ncbi:membrane protein DedA with SNARE-associated domain [Bacillus pakistanensis]|uniref:Membrane protein DedA with SNARE-associated domain n=1 Tax=Rossellomorea pakistanensis TaxID=992288 RepID=A0ABS2NIT0_9BACI|nr:DedA family protein [Bacillus pakistanensis]MBM7587775.1 membrane protein DedA with SNARE-associated domain [Bacillus pakistanensis]
MSIDTIEHYINSYGYIIIFFLLFFGIVGIPAPEESLLFLIGILIINEKLSFGYAVISALLGVFLGMLTAYGCGKFVGYPFIQKYGKYIGISTERWNKAKAKYTKNVKRTIVLGFYLPGIRQISPYFAGIAEIQFKTFFLYSLVGSLCWTIPFIVVGYYAGEYFEINPKYVPYLGLALLVIFLFSLSINYLKEKYR